MMHDSPELPGSTTPDLRALADFVVVAELGHLTRAAELLGVPQSTLSRRIRRLETALGTDLLVRRGRGVAASRAGVRLAEVARRALEDLDRGVAELVGAQDAGRGVVHLAFLHTLGPSAVPLVIREFHRNHPEVRFRLVQEGHDGVVGKLRDGDVDVALTAPLPVGPDVGTVPLVQQELCLVVPRAHALASRSTVRLASLAAEIFVGFKQGYGMRQIADEWCRAAGFVPRLAFEGEDAATVRGLVAAGLGVALLPAQGVASGVEVVEVETHPRRTRTVGAAWLSDHAPPPPARAFRDFLVTRGPDLLAGGERHAG